MSEEISVSNRSLTPPAPPPPPPPRISTETTDRKQLRILVFHGYEQNGAIFREQIVPVRKAISKYAQLVFISAPNKVENEDGGDYRSWWFNAEGNTFSEEYLGGPALGFDATLDLIEKTVNDYGPFDGFMGFGQGACLVGLLAAMQQKGYLSYTFKFAIFVSGFISGSLVHREFYDDEIKLPSLHIYGENDSVVPKEMSKSFVNLFSRPVVAQHSGGYYVTCTGPIKEAYQNFLSDRYQEMLV